MRNEVWTFSTLIFIDLGENTSENNSFIPRTNFVLHSAIDGDLSYFSIQTTNRFYTNGITFLQRTIEARVLYELFSICFISLLIAILQVPLRNYNSSSEAFWFY